MVICLRRDFSSATPTSSGPVRDSKMNQRPRLPPGAASGEGAARVCYLRCADAIRAVTGMWRGSAATWVRAVLQILWEGVQVSSYLRQA